MKKKLLLQPSLKEKKVRHKILKEEINCANAEVEARSCDSDNCDVNCPPPETENQSDKMNRFVDNAEFAENKDESVQLSKFLIKKDLMLGRLTSFNDSTEQFVVWKTGFKNVVSDLSVSNEEEVDLLIKWLGPQS